MSRIPDAGRFINDECLVRVDMRQGEKHSWRFAKSLALALLAFSVVLVCIQYTVSELLLLKLNDHLHHMVSTNGEADRIETDLLRGRCQIRRIVLGKGTNAIAHPVVVADTIDISLRGNALLQGKLVSEIEIHRVFVNAKNTADSTIHALVYLDSILPNALKKLAPGQLAGIKITRGTVKW